MVPTCGKRLSPMLWTGQNYSILFSNNQTLRVILVYTNTYVLRIYLYMQTENKICDISPTESIVLQKLDNREIVCF